jgi:hypothetical protein
MGRNVQAEPAFPGIESSPSYVRPSWAIASAPADRCFSRYLPDSVYSLILLPLNKERHCQRN